MKKIHITVVVDLYDEYLGEENIEIEINDASYEKLIPLCDKMDDGELEDNECHDLLENEVPYVLSEIEKAVDDAMPDYITPDVDEGETLEDYSWTLSFNSILL